MDINALIHGFGSIGMFNSRAFLPAFVTAVSLRYGSSFPIIGNLDLLQATGAEPTWFTHNGTIAALALLALVEASADKMPEAKQVLQGIDKYSKTVLAGLTYMGVVNAVDVQFIDDTLAYAHANAGIFDALPAMLVAAGTFLTTSLRNGVHEIIATADEDDDLGLQNLISWAGDLWAGCGILLLLAFPILMLLVTGGAIGLLWLIKKYFLYREKKSKAECASCGEPIYRHALACPKCSTKVDKPSKVGIFGQSKKQPAGNLEVQPYRLAAKKRCPVCATRLTGRTVKQTCQACGHPFMEDQEFAEKYASRITRRLPGVLVITALLSLIPVLGLVPGIIYYRLRLVAPFRQYIPRGCTLALKWMIRLFFFILIALQWIPGLGGIVVPLMALTSYTAFKNQFHKLAGIG